MNDIFPRGGRSRFLPGGYELIAIHVLSLIKLTIPYLPTKSKVDRSIHSHVTVNQKRLTFSSHTSIQTLSDGTHFIVPSPNLFGGDDNILLQKIIHFFY